MMKVCIAIAGILSSLVLYCCIVIGKRADEHIKRLFERESGSEEGKKLIKACIYLLYLVQCCAEQMF